MRTLVIVDIDGTIADIRDYLGYLVIKPKNYEAFRATIPFHKPIQESIDLINILAYNKNYDIVFVTGRSDVCRELTEKWLAQHFNFEIELYMRKEGDYRKAHLTKKDIVEPLMNGYTNFLALEDEPNNVIMFRELGFICYDVGRESVPT